MDFFVKTWRYSWLAGMFVGDGGGGKSFSEIVRRHGAA